MNIRYGFAKNRPKFLRNLEVDPPIEIYNPAEHLRAVIPSVMHKEPQ